jgi:hypothetical protein
MTAAAFGRGTGSGGCRVCCRRQKQGTGASCGVTLLPRRKKNWLPLQARAAPTAGTRRLAGDSDSAVDCQRPPRPRQPGRRRRRRGGADVVQQVGAAAGGGVEGDGGE